MAGFSWKRWLAMVCGRRVSRRTSPLPLALTAERIEPRTLLSIHAVSDINQVSRDSDPQNFLQIGNLTYFTADDGAHGQELWKTDGTALGTVLVKDIHPTSGIYSGSYPSNFTNVGGVLYFTADDGVHGTELWKSDGTAGGTQLVSDLQVGDAFASSQPRGLVSFNGKLFFTADDGSHGRELWSTDGTSVGTVRITDLNTTGDSFLPETQLVNLNGQLIFAASQGATGTQLWTSTGTTAGTTLLKSIRSGGDGITTFDTQHLAATASTLYFVADSGTTGSELWKTDGTALGTSLVKDIQSGAVSSDPQSLTIVGSSLFFTATTSSAGQELWKSDGSSGGTVMVSDVRSGATGASISNLTPFQGKLYFSADNGVAGSELWQSDGSSGGTTLVKNINPGAAASAPTGLRVVGSTLFFTADDGVVGRELWKSDGTANGTQLVRDIRVGSAGSSSEVHTAVFGSFNNTLLFSSDEGSHGLDLWSSDGTVNGTQLLKDINPVTVGSYPSGVTSTTGGVVFAANDGVNGTELWFSNGIANNSFILVDANSGVAGSVPADLIRINNTIYFTALSGSQGRELWKTDGTTAGTMIVKDINPGVASANPQELVNFNGALYFSAIDDVSGRELWTSDGTSAGTVRVADITVGGGSSSPSNLVSTGTTLYFRANGDQLWKSDGTTGGTQLVADVNVAGDAQLSQLTNVSGTLFFVATNGTQGLELWTSDGTAGNTKQVLDIRTGATGSAPHGLTASNGKLFFVANDGTHGDELWVSNGTAVGTQLVSDIVVGEASSQPSNLTDVNGVLYFSADDSVRGAELWKSTGIAGTTQLVADVQSGSVGSNPHNLANVNGVLYFAANDGIHGNEPWKSTGTTIGTQLVGDLNPGTVGSIPNGFTSFGSFVVFAADDGVRGVELMSDVANRPPIVGTTQFTIPSGAVNGTVIGNLNASDLDGGQSLTYEIRSGNTSNAFALNATTGQIVVSNATALSSNTQFSLTVRVTDNGSPSGYTDAVITIGAAPANQAPTISNQGFSVAENSANGTNVGTVVASDPDVGQSLNYAITAGNAAGAFSINALTGQIVVSNATALSSNTQFSLTVRVTDNGSPSRYTDAVITIGVAPTNQAPTISNQSFSVAENSATGTNVGTVVASDPDVGQLLNYAITAGNAAGAFSINALTGQITVSNTSLLNFEATPSFSLTVLVTDNGSSPASKSATITINLTNVDEPLLITLPSGTATYVRRASPLFAGAGATVSDPDVSTVNFAGGSVTASISQGSIKTDSLKIVAGGGITLKGKNVLFNGTIIGKWAGGTKGSALTITLNGSATQAAVTQLLRRIGYSNTTKKTPAAPRTIQFRVTDAARHTSAPALKPVTLV
ncbi:MAG: ELWxxDGT repeat protein [Planctomycetota bacterium]